MQIRFGLIFCADTNALSYSFGAEPSYWYGPAHFGRAEASVASADLPPFGSGDPLNLSLYCRSQTPIHDAVPSAVGVNNAATAHALGALDHDDEALCMWVQNWPQQEQIFAAAFLTDANYSELTRALIASQAGGRQLLVAGELPGFRNAAFDQEQLPSRSDFAAGSIYTCRQRFNFALVPSG